MKLSDIKNLQSGQRVRQVGSHQIFEIKSVYFDLVKNPPVFKIFFTDGTFTKDEEYLKNLIWCEEDVPNKLTPFHPLQREMKQKVREFVIPAFPESIVLTASENPKFKENQEIVYVWGDGYLTDPVNWKRENGIQPAREEATGSFILIVRG